MTELTPLLICNALKGSAAKVITAFLMAGTALDIDGLIEWTCLERHTISEALKQLKRYGLVVRQVMAHNRVIWMLATNVFPATRTIGDPGNDRKVLQTLQMEGFPPSDALIIINNDSTYLKDSINNNNKGQLEGIPPTGPTESVSLVSSSVDSAYQRSPGELDALIKALGEFRIVGKKKDELIGLEWVDAEEVRAQVEFAKAEGRAEYAVGMAITRMIDHAPRPTRRENGHIENCTCSECKTSDVLEKYRFDIPGRDDDEEIEMHCLWQDELEEIIEAGPLRGQHLKTPYCEKVVTNDSSKWCDEHLQIGIETYGE